MVPVRELGARIAVVQASQARALVGPICCCARGGAGKGGVGGRSAWWGMAGARGPRAPACMHTRR